MVGIPGFWLQCLSNNSSVGYLITEEDIPALESLIDIKVDYDPDYTAFTLSFTFSENDYFTDKVK